MMLFRFKSSTGSALRTGQDHMPSMVHETHHEIILIFSTVHFPFDCGTIEFLMDRLSTVLSAYTCMHAIPSTWNTTPSISSGKLLLLLHTLPGYSKISSLAQPGQLSNCGLLTRASTPSKKLLGIHILGPHPRISKGRA